MAFASVATQAPLKETATGGARNMKALRLLDSSDLDEFIPTTGILKTVGLGLGA